MSGPPWIWLDPAPASLDLARSRDRKFQKAQNTQKAKKTGKNPKPKNLSPASKSIEILKEI